jgi:GAF domain-containing protein
MARWCKAVPGSEPRLAGNDQGEGPTASNAGARTPKSAAGIPRRHDLLGVLLGFQQLGRRFVDGEMDTDDFLLETCRRIAEAMSCHDVVIWTFSERVDDRLALCPLARYDAQCDALGEDIQPCFGRTTNWHQLIEDGYQLPSAGPQAGSLLGAEACGMLEVTYGVNAEPLGILACGRHVNGGPWTHEQVQLLRRIASRIGVALLRATASAVSSRRRPGQLLVLAERPID